jgi:hypothetical protein
MKFKVYNDSFPLVLIRASAVQEIFDQDDLSARQNADRPVLDKYHKNWVHNGVMLVPSFHIRDDNARVGMGRHRLIMLSRHMTEIPAAFELEYSESSTLEKILSTIVLRKIDEFEEFEYPNLPTEDLGSDINGGLDWKRYV